MNIFVSKSNILLILLFKNTKSIAYNGLIKQIGIFMRYLSFLLILLIFIHPTTTNASESVPNIQADSAILIEASTGQVIYEKNADEILAPASITKIMTLLLIFQAIDSNQITKEDVVTISEHAASMGGSQVFLETGEKQTVDTLIKCIAIASANDACVAMAEHIAGSEEQFVEKMNQKAKDLGMNSTNFVNCCGLDANGHVTTAKDVSIMSKELINKYPEIHDYSTIWMDTITHYTKKGETKFTLTNTNKLLKQYEWATGLKTGSTGKAKFCLSASASRNGIELISVIMASPSGKTRVSDTISLLNYGYGKCKLYKGCKMGDILYQKITGGTTSKLLCTYESDFSYLFTEDYDEKLISYSDSLNNIKAPVSISSYVGKRTYYYDKKEIGSVKIIACEKIEKAKYSHYLNKIYKKLLFAN